MCDMWLFMYRSWMCIVYSFNFMCWVSTFFSWQLFFLFFWLSVLLYYSIGPWQIWHYLYYIQKCWNFQIIFFQWTKLCEGKLMDSFSKFWSIILFNMESSKWDNCSTLKCSTCYGTTVMGLPSHISKCTLPSRCILSVDNKWQLT